jgi:flavodoxin
MKDHDPLRRAVMVALAALPLSGTASTSGGEERRTGSRTLVAYFSRTGNTRVVAGLVHRTLGTDLFEIRPATPYPEDYLATVEQARQERDSSYKPALADLVLDIQRYHTVYLGFPIWGETAPPIIRAFLNAHDLSDKTLIPFITHGGYGPGNSLRVLKDQAPKALLQPEFVMEADQERKTMNSVTSWLSGT